MEAASFKTPSPNKIEFKVGNFLSLIKFKAATVSVAHKTAESCNNSNWLTELLNKLN